MTGAKHFTLLAIIVSSILAAHATAATVSFRLKAFASDSVQAAQNDTLVVEEPEYIPVFPDEVIQDRLSCIESEIPLTFNPFVRKYIDYFTIRNRKYMGKMIARENLYFPLFETYLKKHNMPQELRYLAVVESGLYPKAVSHAGAVGLWQFMKMTGKDFGLKQTDYVDERMDPDKATEAACRFLKQLHRMFGDWELALAAYNCGPGNVNKAIRRAGGGKKTFWQIFPYLPTETRGYVPSMTAIMYTMHYAAEHNIFSDSILYAPAVTHLQLDQTVDLEKLAAELHVETDLLMALNTELKQQVLPESMKNYKLRVPAQSKALLATDQHCIMLAAAPTPKNSSPQAPDDQPMLAATTPDSIVQKTYLVKRGDNLLQISQKYQVTVSELKEWNKLKSNNIHVNQKLSILQPAPADQGLLAAAAPATPKAKTKAAPRKVNSTTLPKVRAVHHVQEGDTLWNISQKYDGITVEQIKKRNNLKSNAIKPGQKLIIS